MPPPQPSTLATPQAIRQAPGDEFSTPLGQVQTAGRSIQVPLTWDWTQIHRVLRPLRAKLLSLSRQLQLPSSAASMNDRESSRYGSNSISFLSSKRQQSSMQVKAVYQRKSTNANLGVSTATAPPPETITNFAPIPTASNSNIPSQSSKNSSYLSSASTSVYRMAPRSQLALSQTHQSNRQIPSPIRRDAMYLRTIVNDALRKIGPCGSRQFRRTRIYSLVELAAFSVGTQVEYFEDLDEQEAIYDFIPEHHRRFTLLQHIVELCIAYPCGVFVVKEMVSALSVYQAHNQIFSLLCHAFHLPRLNCESALWVYNTAKSIQKGRALLEYLITTVLNRDISQSPFLLPFCQSIADFDMVYRLALKVLDVLLVESAREGRGIAEDCRERVKAWVSILVSRLFLVSNRILPSTISRDLSLLLCRFDWKGNSLAETCLKIGLLHFATDPLADEEIDVKETQHGQIGYLIFSFGSLERIKITAEILQRNNHVALAAKIMFLIVKEYNALKTSSATSNTRTPSLKECQEFLGSLENQLMDSTVKKYYDPDFDIWVLGTPPCLMNSKGSKRQLEELDNEIPDPQSDLFQTPAPKKNRLYSEPYSFGEDIGPIATDTDYFFDSLFVRTPAKRKNCYYNDKLARDFEIENDDSAINNGPYDSAFLFSGDIMPESKSDAADQLFSPQSGAGIF